MVEHSSSQNSALMHAIALQRDYDSSFLDLYSGDNSSYRKVILIPQVSHVISDRNDECNIAVAKRAYTLQPGTPRYPYGTIG